MDPINNFLGSCQEIAELGAPGFVDVNIYNALRHSDCLHLLASLPTPCPYPALFSSASSSLVHTSNQNYGAPLFVFTRREDASLSLFWEWKTLSKCLGKLLMSSCPGLHPMANPKPSLLTLKWYVLFGFELGLRTDPDKGKESNMNDLPMEWRSSH
jgi:hypothetical protein